MDDPSPNRRTTAFDICHSLWPGFGRATTRAHPASAPGLWKQCTRSVLCSQYVLFPDRKCPLGGPKHADYQGQMPNPAKTTEKTNASLGGEAQVMGGFPKRSGCLYKIYGAEPS